VSSFPGSPRLLKGGIVLLDPTSGAVRRIIVLQYNPDTLTRTLQVQAVGTDQGGRAQALRLKAPPAETIRVEAEVDATDQLETPERFADTARLGIHPQLAVLEGMVSPSSVQLAGNDALMRAGTLEIIPMESPLSLFVWSASRIVPVRVTELSITEEAFDPALNPLRAKVTLGLRVLTVDDLGFDHRGGTLYLAHLRRKEQLADRAHSGALGLLGIAGIA
jgi:hypothetical protein